ncbi:hypothetical protein VTL71DRAFT_12698 [Oculimacula yallundae]|uniref:Uncharacterized protein n=1 Tax=Oculimacula yallundae TaxID=86028 RepID=A0ABR4CN69_9HELO
MASQNLANFALDGGDPRVEKNLGQFALDNGHEGSIDKDFSIEAAQVHNDPSVLFEEYLHYAFDERFWKRWQYSYCFQLLGRWTIKLELD